MSSASGRRSEPAGNRLIEIFAVGLLAVATVGSAWCAYQSSRWSGEETRLNQAASAERVEASRLFALATQTLSYDTNTLGLYASAVAEDNQVLAEFYLDAMVRPPMTAVIDDWTAAVEAGEPPVRLLDDEEYRSALLGPYDDATVAAEVLVVEAAAAGENSDSYILATVLLAISLFFAGVTSSFRVRLVRVVLLGAAGFALAYAAGTIAGLPVL